MPTNARAHASTFTRTPAATAVIVLVAGLAGASPGQAQLTCGDTVAAGSKVALAGDIGPCNLPGPALTVEGPAKVNFKGFKVTCGANITGIQILGTKAEITNGYIKNCRDGVDVSGDGKHKVIKMTVRSIRTMVGQRGFRVRSDRNRLTMNLADRFNGEGFRIQGDENRVIRNKAVRNKGHGFRVDGDRNALKSNLADANGTRNSHGKGFRIDGSGNRVENSKARANRGEGFHIGDGQDNRLIANRSLENGIFNNEAGIRADSNHNTIAGNNSYDNYGYGILLTEGSTNNTIKFNAARHNGGTGLVDGNLNPPCDDNRWTENSSDSRSQDCIR